jgi:hypothetical protein
LRIADCGLRIADCGLRIEDCGFGNCGLEIAGSQFSIANRIDLNRPIQSAIFSIQSAIGQFNPQSAIRNPQSAIS